LEYGTSGDYATQTISDISKEYGTLTVLEKKSFVLNTREVAVESGDTAYSIARKYNMPLARLAALNNLNEPEQLKVGQKLKIEQAEIVTTKTEITKSGTESPAAAPPSEKEPIVKSGSAVKLPGLSARAGTKFAWPVKGDIIADFGPKSGGLSNDGINIAAPLGSGVSSAENGVVAYAGNEMKGFGNLLIIQHAGGWMTVYAHLDNFTVRRGDKVEIGQKIGTVGKTGKVSEPQLGFQVRKGAKAYNPKEQLRA
jgi:murein DD-endopeptidase MepM/ murein hydrolase activator NlpD